MAVDGTYKIEMDTPMGKQELTLTLKADGNTLTGTAASQMGNNDFTGNVDGDKFDFSQNISSPMGDMKIDTSGEVNGDDISGVMKSQFGDTPFAGKRI